MLQPVQLQEVFTRYPREITELRRFLVQAGVPVQSERVASYMAGRLAQDRRFHRDLMSYLWVLLDEHPAQIGAAELLGMLAIAAAGIPNASQMEEDDAHDLLRFVMESRRALGSAERPQARQERPVPEARLPERPVLQPKSVEGPGPEPKLPSRIAPASALPRENLQLQPAERPVTRQMEVRPQRPTPVRASTELTAVKREAPPERPLHNRSEESAWLAPEEVSPAASERTRRRLVYAFSGACVLALLVGGYGLLHRSEPTPHTPAALPMEQGGAAAYPVPAVRDSAAAFGTSTATEVTEPASGTRQRLAHPEQRTASIAPTARQPLPAASSAPNTSPVAEVPTVRQAETARLEPSRTLPTPVTSAAAPIVRTGPGSSAIPAAGVTLRTTRPASGVPQAVSASSLSRQLDSPRMPNYANDPDVTAAGKPYPRLRRRNTAGALQENDPELVAEMHAPNLTGGAHAASHALPSGVVRGTCLGMMAGNLMYSPTPAYPQAAAAARVQGEVKIQATIDRDGSVSSARVVSGPPLLRDAALDAVQHWRYKPYTSGGKPSPTGTMAVVEFQLQ